MFSSNTTQVSDGGYQISRSLRFNSADSAYLNRTPASAGNRRTWTFSAWVKRSALSGGNYPQLMSADGGTFGSKIGYFADDTFWVDVGQGATYTRLTSTAVYRDVSAWYHVVVAQDTTQATSTDRVKVYINGSQITLSGTYPTQNFDGSINNNSAQNIGRETSASYYFNGYMTEVNLIDGQALTPSSFGETNAQTGVWQPKAYSGSYGTNGFYLNFSDNSNTTAATLGKDYSGNGNNWTPNGFSVSTGIGNDSLVDVPISYGTDTGVGGTVRGNYATLNPLSVVVGTTSNGNLDGDTGTTNGGVVYATMNIPNSGKWYWEYTQTNTGTSYSGIETVVSSTSGSITNIVRYIGDGTKQVDGTTSSYGASYGNTDIIGTAVDVDAGTVTFYKNGTSQGAITYATASINVSPSWRDGSGSASLSYSANFGQRPFAYTAPSGFKALCTQNLPTPTIGATTATQAGKFFNPVLYTGNGSSLSVTGVGFQPDWTWLKARNAAYTNLVTDAVRGAGKSLYTNATDAETTNDSNGYLSSFNSDGFSLNGGPRVNANTTTYVAWNWKANGSGSSNTAGQITSTVSANTTSGFSVVTFTADGTTKTVGHGLGVKPSLVIVKGRNSVGSWITMTDIINGSMQYGALNSTAAFASIGYSAPTSSVFQYNDNNGNTQVAYCFAPIAGYSAFGTYTGNGSADGPFIYTGFRPAYVMVKPSSAAGAWWINDNKRDTYNVNDHRINANTSDAEATSGFTQQDFLSNGFKWRNSDSAWNGSGVTYIYMAFAENPFKYSLAR